MTSSINNSLQHNKSVVNFAPTAFSDQRRFGFQPSEPIETRGYKFVFLNYSISCNETGGKYFRYENRNKSD